MSAKGIATVQEIEQRKRTEKEEDCTHSKKQQKQKQTKKAGETIDT